MARNIIPRQLDRLFALSEDAIDGLTAIGTATGVAQNIAPVVQSALDSARQAEMAYQTARAAKITLNTAQTVADSNGKAFIATAKRVLMTPLGQQWSTAWAEAGFVNGSLAMPGTAPERFALLGSLATYLTVHPAHENAPLFVTAALASAKSTAVSAARTAFHAGLQNLGTTRQSRETAVATLRTRLRGLIDELGTLLEDDDPRWYQFGLNAPADPETPGIPEAPTPTPGAPASGMLFLDWPDARRAERYRVWRKLPTDADFLAVETTTESESTLEDQPLGLAITYRITAANDAGESQPSPEISVTLN